MIFCKLGPRFVALLNVTEHCIFAPVLHAVRIQLMNEWITAGPPRATVPICQNDLSLWVLMHLFKSQTRLTALFLGRPGWAGTRKVKPIWILLKQETVSGSGSSWARCKSAPRCWQITMPAPHHSVFYRPDALPAAQPTASKHWRQIYTVIRSNFLIPSKP